MARENRSYTRENFLHLDAKISIDKKGWESVEICDFSAGGLRFKSEKNLEIGNILWFDLDVPVSISKQEIIVNGVIVRVEIENDERVYGVAFKDVSLEMKITIDEIILYMLHHR